MVAFMKIVLVVLCVIFLSACAQYSTQSQSSASTHSPTNTNHVCAGNTILPDTLKDKLVEVDDPQLLAKALGQPEKGGLCQGKVYKSTEAVTIYRAWNSTNPNSQKGKWWAASQPKGKVAQYREDYEICYQWSPLDIMSQCVLASGTKVVIGTGQSAQCSTYLSYDVSDKKQIFVDDAQATVSACETFDGEFRWAPRSQ